MMRLFSIPILLAVTCLGWAQSTVFQGRIDMGRDLASFETNPPVKGTLYLFSGSAAEVSISRTNPFSASVDFIQAEWQDESRLIAHHVTLQFAGDQWSKIVLERRPRHETVGKVYPFSKFQVAALAMSSKEFRVVAIPEFF